MIELVTRIYQDKIIGDISDAIRRKKRRILTVSPCGSGKTVVFSRIAQGAKNKNKSVAVVAHRKELITQCSDKLNRFGVPHGIVKAGFAPNYLEPIQVASIQTLHRRVGVINPDVFIYDEAHHSQARQAQDVINRHPKALLLGFTASPIFGNGKTLGKYYDELVIGPTVRWLVDEGYLVSTRVFAPPPVDLSGVDYDNITALEAAMNKRKITGDAIAHYSRIAGGLQAICYVTTVKHGQAVAEQFREAGYGFYAIDGGMGDEERDYLLGRFGCRDIQGLVSCDIISEGTDVPSAQVAIKLRPTKSLGLTIQQDGRINRPFYADGMPLDTREQRLAAIAASQKPFAYIIDHVNNSYFHGLPDDEYEWSLTAAPVLKPRPAAFQISRCEVCFQFYRGAACDCGAPRVTKERKIFYTHGQLEEIKKSDALERKRREEEEKKRLSREVNQARTLAQLQEIGRQRGYDKMWAVVKFKSRRH